MHGTAMCAPRGPGCMWRMHEGCVDNAPFHMDQEWMHGYARLRADSDFIEVSDGIHSLCEPHLGSLLHPEVRLSVGLEEHAQQADKVPCGERKACIVVALLHRNVLHSWSGWRHCMGRPWTHEVVDRDDNVGFFFFISCHIFNR